MESLNAQVRTAPNTSGNRNGMPPSGGYVYRGWYIDIMPWADLRGRQHRLRNRPGAASRAPRDEQPVQAVQPRLPQPPPPRPLPLENSRLIGAGTEPRPQLLADCLQLGAHPCQLGATRGIGTLRPVCLDPVLQCPRIGPANDQRDTARASHGVAGGAVTATLTRPPAIARMRRSTCTSTPARTPSTGPGRSRPSAGQRRCGAGPNAQPRARTRRGGEPPASPSSQPSQVGPAFAPGLLHLPRRFRPQPDLTRDLGRGLGSTHRGGRRERGCAVPVGQQSADVRSCHVGLVSANGPCRYYLILTPAPFGDEVPQPVTGRISWRIKVNTTPSYPPGVRCGFPQVHSLLIWAA